MRRHRFRRLAAHLAALALSLCAASIAFAADELDKEREHSYLKSVDGKRIWDYELLREVDRHLYAAPADTMAITAFVYTASCRSKGFSAEARKWLEPAQNWFTGSSRNYDAPFEQEWKEKYDVNNKSSMNNKDGLKVRDQAGAQKALYAHGWGIQVFRAIKTDLNRRQFTGQNANPQGIWTYAGVNDFQGGIGPDLDSGGTGADSTLVAANGTNRAGIWWVRTERIPVESQDLMVKAAQQILVDTQKLDEAKIELAYDNKPNDAGTTVDRKATRDELIGKDGLIAKIAEELRAGPRPRHAFLFLWSHGGSEKERAPKKPAAVPNEKKQGKLFVPGDARVVLHLSPGFRDAFFADLVDDTTISRAGNPAVTLTTSEETYSGTVHVTIDGVAVGNFPMDGSSLGGNYDMPISQSAWSLLQSSGVVDDSVEVSFSFPSGSFRVATEWDCELDSLPHYGVGLAGPPIRGEALDDTQGIPAPGASSGALVAGAIALAAGGAWFSASRGARKRPAA